MISMITMITTITMITMITMITNQPCLIDRMKLMITKITLITMITTFQKTTYLAPYQAISRAVYHLILQQ